MAMRLLSVGLAVFFLLGNENPPHVIEVETSLPQVEVEACRLTSVKNSRTGENETTEICSPISALTKRSGTMFKLRLRVSVSNEPLAGEQVRLKVSCQEVGCAADGLLARWDGALTGTTDAAGEVVFDGLFLTRDVPDYEYLLVFVGESEDISRTKYLPVYREPTKITGFLYSEVEILPPVAEWSLSYDEDIPAGATVHWHVKSKANGQAFVSGEKKHTIDKATHKLELYKRAFSCHDFSSEDNYYELYVRVASPSFSLVNVIKSKGGCVAHQPLPSPN